MSLYTILATAQMCMDVHSVRDLAQTYQHQAALDLHLVGHYVELADLYDPFSNGVAVLREFAMSQMAMGPDIMSETLDARSLWLREESVRLTIEAHDLLDRAEDAPSRWAGLRRLNVPAMRLECLDVLIPPP
ncbi:hypothetical protein HY631_04225 [Candidatus Uhrbacteria bacterium]|nr:hypothetical protein [Candidatus Uhrbacteria bacterium]